MLSELLRLRAELLDILRSPDADQSPHAVAAAATGNHQRSGQSCASSTPCLLRDRSRAPRVSAEAARPAEQANGPGLHHQRRSRHDLEEIAVSGQAGSR
jgi:hypothetical protein